MQYKKLKVVFEFKLYKKFTLKIFNKREQFDSLSSEKKKKF